MTSAIPLGLALACAAALAACGDAGAGEPIADVAVHRVERRDLRVTVSEKGTLKAVKQVLVRPQIPGQAKIVSLVEEGTQVQAGDLLAELDRTEVQREVDDLSNRIIALTAELDAAEKELEIQLSQNDADVQDADLSRRFAEVELERWEKGEFIQEKARKEIRVEEAKSELERATRKYEQMPALEEEGFVTKSQVEEERIKKVKAESELLLAELDLKTYLDYAAPKDRAQREADVRNATLEVDRARKRAEAREAQRRGDVDRKQNELDSVGARLDERRTVLGNMTIRAPGPGIVIYGDARNPWEDREVKVGEAVYAGQPFITLPDLSEMLVEVAIHEADIARIRVGQKAFVTVEAARDTVLPGSVARVAQVAAKSNRWGGDTKRFSVEVALEGDISAMKLKPGLSAQVEILVDEISDALVVPVQAVFSQRGRFHVFRRTGSAAERVDVEIAPGNSQFAVVTKGLEEGEEVLLYDPAAAGEAAAAEAGAESPPSGPAE